jgi:hypothetical protein
MVEVPAQKLLLAWLTANSVTQTEFAANFGDLKQSSVSSWIRGTARPRPAYRTVIEALTGISEDEWLSPEDRKARDTYMRAATRARRSQRVARG